jgi:leucyl-tRNA synthetase
LVPTPEPYMKRTSHGMILGENNEKMSKSRGNVINPDKLIEKYGADTLRAYEMFIGDFEKSVPWSENGLKGCRRFLEKVWSLQNLVVSGENYSSQLEVIMHKTIKKVSYDYEHLKFNTAIASIMTLVNKVLEIGRVNKAELNTVLILLNPAAPHITEELWCAINSGTRLNKQKWPEYDENKALDREVEIAVQINGKVKGKINIMRGDSKDTVKSEIFKDEKIEAMLNGKTIVKEIYVPEKIYNIVVK